jgi:hypothetical protein
MNRSTMTYLYQYIIPYITYAVEYKSVVSAETRVSKAPYSYIKAVGAQKHTYTALTS